MNTNTETRGLCVAKLPRSVNIPLQLLFPQRHQEATMLSSSWTPTKWIPDAWSWETGAVFFRHSTPDTRITVQDFDRSSWAKSWQKYIQTCAMCSAESIQYATDTSNVWACLLCAAVESVPENGGRYNRLLNAAHELLWFRLYFISWPTTLQQRWIFHEVHNVREIMIPHLF